MILSCIDTCTWLNLASNYYKDDYELLTKIEDLVNANKLYLVLPEIIITEWNRHKDSKITNKMEISLTSKVKNFKEISDYLEDGDKDSLRTIIEKVTSSATYFKSAGEDKISRVEKLFNHKNTKIIPIIDEIKILASEYALNNQKPFTKNKNSMGDALIFLTATEYARGFEQPFYFITDNKDDFSSQNQNELHDDLKQRISEVIANKKDRDVPLDFHYYINIATALNKIERNIVSREIEKSIQEQLSYPALNYTSNAILCSKCGAQLDDRNNGCWKHSRYGASGLTWWLICHKCGTGYDTGEYFD